MRGVFLVLLPYLHCLLGKQAKLQVAIDPTGAYKLVSKTKKVNGEVYGYSGDIKVKLLSNARIAVSFYVDKGYPSYNSGSFVDTLSYDGEKAIYKTEYDASCKIIFKFSDKGVILNEQTNDYNFGCGFGHAIIASGFYKKYSSAAPVIKDWFK